MQLWNTLTNFLTRSGEYSGFPGKKLPWSKVLNFDDTMAVIASNPALKKSWAVAANEPDKHSNWVAAFVKASTGKAAEVATTKTKLKMAKPKHNTLKNAINADDIIEVLFSLESVPGAYNLVSAIADPKGVSQSDAYERVTLSPHEELKVIKDIEIMVHGLDPNQIEELIADLAEIDQERYDELGPEEYARTTDVDVRKVLGLPSHERNRTFN